MTFHYPPRVPNPKRDAENRARLISKTLRILPWIGAIPLLLFLLMVYGYSDQAPAALRELTIEIDNFFGQPIWSLIAPRPK
jgi:hypothetical protein